MDLSVHVFEVGFGQFFIFSARNPHDTQTLALQKTRGWRHSVGVQSSESGLKMRLRGYFSSEFSLAVAPY